MKKPASENRSMDTSKEEKGTLFFFPRRDRPVSVRAASREEAEKKLHGETNAQEA